MSGSEITTQQRAEDLKVSVQSAHQRIEELRQELAEERELRQQAMQRMDEMESKLKELDQRTDLLSLLEQSSTVGGEQAQAALIQHLWKKAKKRERMGNRPAAALDREAAEEALHHPEVDRTTILKWMKRAADRADGKILQYDGGRPAQLKINLQAGDLPEQFVTGGDL